MPSLTEIVVILLALLVIVGPERLPQLARTVGDGLKKLRRTTNMFRDLMMYEEESSPLDVPDPLDQTPIDSTAEATVEEPVSTSDDDGRDAPGLYGTPLPPPRTSERIRRVELAAAQPTEWTRGRALAPPHRRIP